MNLSPETPSSRIVFVDVARAFSVLFMVQGHALDVLLAPSHRLGTAFNTWLFLRGITAPMFLVLAGFAFSIVTIRRWDSYLHYSREMRRRIVRFVSLIFFGYLMHFPVRSPLDIFGMSPDSWQSWFQVDVLQCIGITLLTLQILIVVLRTPERIATLAGVAACCIALVTPFMWNPKLTGALPAVLSAYCNGLSGSVFPLFPWAAYVCGGVWLGHWYLNRNTVSVPRLMGGVGVALVALGFALEKPMTWFFDNYALWRTSPSIFILKVGCVCVFLSVIDLVSRHVSFPRKTTQALAQESLSVYLVHVAVLYGSAWNLGLRQYIGDRLGVASTLLWIVTLLVAMVLFAVTWNGLKKRLRQSHKPKAPVALRVNAKSKPAKLIPMPLCNSASRD